MVEMHTQDNHNSAVEIRIVPRAHGFRMREFGGCYSCQLIETETREIVA